jgi:hypothetical protein
MEKKATRYTLLPSAYVFADKLKAFATKQGISLEYDKSISPTQGVSFENRRYMPPNPRRTAGRRGPCPSLKQREQL